MSAVEKKAPNAFDSSLWELRSKEYARLNWVNAKEPIKQFLEILSLKGSETIVDMGTGSQVLKNAMEGCLTTGRIFGFDISSEMLNCDGRNLCRDNLFIASATHIPINKESTDIVTARMVLHHIPDLPAVLTEAGRILKSEGRLVVAEHVALSDQVLEFEKELFRLKEPDRHLWTAEQLIRIVKEQNIFNKIECYYGVLPQYNMTEWMKNSGLEPQIQKRVTDYFSYAPDAVKQELNIQLSDEEVSMDGHYIIIVAQKK